MDIYKVPAAVLLALTLSACGGADTAQDDGGDTSGDVAQGDTGGDTSGDTGGDTGGQDDVVELIPGIGVNGNLQAVPSKSEE